MKETAKSKYRGVYKCGKRWKAQIQSNGVQYYLGTYDKEEDAAVAYECKARAYRAEKLLGNVNGATSSDADDGRRNYADILGNPADYATSNADESPGVFVDSNHFFLDYSNYQMNDVFVQIMWERFCQLSQRLLLATVARKNINVLQDVISEQQRLMSIQSLDYEIDLLTGLKNQIEESIASRLSENFAAQKELIGVVSNSTFGEAAHHAANARSSDQLKQAHAREVSDPGDVSDEPDENAERVRAADNTTMKLPSIQDLLHPTETTSNIIKHSTQDSSSGTAQPYRNQTNDLGVLMRMMNAENPAIYSGSSNMRQHPHLSRNLVSDNSTSNSMDPHPGNASAPPTPPMWTTEHPQTVIAKNIIGPPIKVQKNDTPES